MRRHPLELDAAMALVRREIARGPAADHDVAHATRLKGKLIGRCISELLTEGRIIVWGRIDDSKQPYNVYSVPEHAQVGERP